MINRICALFLVVFVILELFTVNCNAYSASSYAVYYPLSGEFLSYSDMNKKMSMASTTKILTGLIICRQPDMSKTVKVTAEMLKVEGTSAGLCDGDSISLLDLCYGLMLESGNDCANCAAFIISGGITRFAELMNKTAAEIGMTASHFVTPSGLDADGHYTTAHDMALLTAEALKNETFKKIVSTKTHKAVYNNGDTVRTYSNHNRLLRELDGCIGVKTGFTKKSGRCLISACERNGSCVIVVTLNAPDDWNDHKALHEQAFSSLTKVELGENLPNSVHICGGAASKVGINRSKTSILLTEKSAKDVKCSVILPDFIYAPVKANENVGKAVYSINGVKIAEIPLNTAEKCDRVVIAQNNSFWYWFIKLLFS